MVQVTLLPELLAFIAARIVNYETEATEPFHRWEAPTVGEFAAVPLIRHWYETIGLRADGEIVRWSTDHREPYLGVRPVEERYDWLSALVEGARRWPELRALLPTRPARATACQCVGNPMFAAGKFICPACCGLEWVEA
ncbi:MAG: hypothetical protein K8T89_20005 [Planctomycetes bacterium]|nr:hypothetical protein [Planctomycetota bacterium]